MDSQSQPLKLEELQQELARISDELNKKNRELEIEAALERVRVRAMGMKDSFELSECSALLFQELSGLKIQALRAAVGIFDEDNDAMEIWLSTQSDSDKVTRIFDYVNLHIHPVYENIIPARKEKKAFALTTLQGEEVRKFYQTTATYFNFSGASTYNPREFFYSFFFSFGCINLVTGQELTGEECRIMERFAQVFGLIYTRFVDLQLAEARSREISQQAALERVRAEISSMRSMSDLQKIAPIMWSELKKLGVLFTRCGIFIVDEPARVIHVYLSSPEGESLAVLTMPWEANKLMSTIVDHWKKGEVYQVHWNKSDFLAWTRDVVAQGQVKDEDSYEEATHPPDELDLHFTPFSGGMIYIGNAYPLNEEEITLALSLSDAFSLAYTRYLDFIQLEKAKQNLEVMLEELNATQAQLIHSEKMASLGELTAGIAHEIQNPLNFVNNFSELNAELLEELNEEAQNGNLQEVRNLASSIRENESKINHHGRRADAIVKSMLQHSRSSSGKKEPTDINQLAEEYLRLAYHGLRAKDKSFNARFESDLDPSMGKVMVVPQDLGRVILNLINNAFYAMNKKKETEQGYEPVLKLETKSFGERIRIIVSDNGPGIPRQVLDKIFQPFFTTKATGEGTGLGLSLSYDIITKGHAGELQVETSEGKGSRFIIEIPKG